MNKIFSLRCSGEKYLKEQNLYVAFMGSEKAYTKVDRDGLWKVLRIMCGVMGRCLKT